MNIRVEVFNKEKYDYDGEWPDENAIGFLAWFENKINSIPEEFRGSAKIKIDSVSGYEGNHYASIEIYYYRPETDEEAKERVDREKIRAELLRQRELMQLEQLKRKYGA